MRVLFRSLSDSGALRALRLLLVDPPAQLSDAPAAAHFPWHSVKDRGGLAEERARLVGRCDRGGMQRPYKQQVLVGVVAPASSILAMSLDLRIEDGNRFGRAPQPPKNQPEQDALPARL